MAWTPAEERYEGMTYNRCGESGLKLPAVSLGLYHNFGGLDPFEDCRAMVRRAFDLGITHFDLANNYGPPPGSAEETFGRVLTKDLHGYRDELVISTKAGWDMWPGPYGDFGSKKYLLASLDQSLARMGLEYVDIFYHHRPDPDTPLEETMGALAQLVRQGKALYVGISQYKPERAREALQMLKNLGTPCLIHQASYSIFSRWVEQGLLDVLTEFGTGCIAFSTLAQGMLTSRYFDGIPDDSRAAKARSGFSAKKVDPAKVEQARKLNELAEKRGQTLAQMAVAWVLRRPEVCSALVGASRVEQIEDIVSALENTEFTEEELGAIDGI